MTIEELQSCFEEAIKAFVSYREKHGGIMIPTEVIIRHAFQDALYETGVDVRPKKTYIIGKGEPEGSPQTQD
jgi:hypothetical protein